MEKFNTKYSYDDITSAEDMVTEEPEQPRKEKKKKKKTKSSTSQSKAEAGEKEDSNKHGALPKIPKSTSDHSDASKPAGKSSETQPEKATGNGKNVPIITCYNINVKNMTNIIDVALGHSNYTLKIMGRNVTNIGVCTISDFEQVKILLKNQKVNYYTYTPKGQKPFSVVIEGLSGTYSVDEVKSYLDGLNININILGLTQLGGDKWLLRLSRESDIKAFHEIRYILRCRVSFRNFKRGKVTQCFNCQRFGHVSSNCEMPYRCVKCGDSHGPGKCDIPSKEDNTAESVVTDTKTGKVTRIVGLPVRCVNCNIQGHVASSKQCPRRLELMKKIEAKKASRVEPQTPRRFNSTTVKAGMSYASVTAAATPSPLQPSANSLSLRGAMADFEIINKDCQRLLGDGLINFLSKIGGFAREYRTLTTDENRSQALLGLLMNINK